MPLVCIYLDIYIRIHLVRYGASGMNTSALGGLWRIGGNAHNLTSVVRVKFLFAVSTRVIQGWRLRSVLPGIIGRDCSINPRLSLLLSLLFVNLFLRYVMASKRSDAHEIYDVTWPVQPGLRRRQTRPRQTSRIHPSQRGCSAGINPLNYRWAINTTFHEDIRKT